MSDNMQKVVVGKRQILRELKNGTIAEIMIASNAEHSYISSLINSAKEYGVTYSINGTMSELASLYGVDVPSGAVGKLK